jgi:hypothetical protein
MWGRLVVSLMVDGLGSASYLLPGVGEMVDVVWAPLQTILIMALYDETSPNLKYLSMVEELLPFTDIVPSATLGWLAEFAVPLLLPPPSRKSKSSHQLSTSWTEKYNTTPLNMSLDGVASSSTASTPVRAN